MHSTTWHRSVTQKKLRKPKDRTSRNLIQRLRKRATPYKKGIIRTGMFVLVVTILYSFLGGSYGLLNLMRLDRKKSMLLEERRQLTAEICELESRSERAQSDSLYIQKLARDRYGLAKKDETIIRVPDKSNY